MRTLSALIDSLWYLRDPDGYVMNGDADVKIKLADGTLVTVAGVNIEGNSVVINIK